MDRRSDAQGAVGTVAVAKVADDQRGRQQSGALRYAPRGQRLEYVGGFVQGDAMEVHGDTFGGLFGQSILGMNFGTRKSLLFLESGFGPETYPLRDTCRMRPKPERR